MKENGKEGRKGWVGGWMEGTMRGWVRTLHSSIAPLRCVGLANPPMDGSDPRGRHATGLRTRGLEETFTPPTHPPLAPLLPCCPIPPLLSSLHRPLCLLGGKVLARLRRRCCRATTSWQIHRPIDRFADAAGDACAVVGSHTHAHAHSFVADFPFPPFLLPPSLLAEPHTSPKPKGSAVVSAGSRTHARTSGGGSGAWEASHRTERAPRWTQSEILPSASYRGALARDGSRTPP